MTRYQARLAMTEARQTFGMNSPEAIDAEKRLAEIERTWTAAQRDTRDPVAKLFQD